MQRHEADLEMLFCLHRGKKRELLCYSLVIKWLCSLGAFLKQALCKGSNLVMVNPEKYSNFNGHFIFNSSTSVQC